MLASSNLCLGLGPHAKPGTTHNEKSNQDMSVRGPCSAKVRPLVMKGLPKSLSSNNAVSTRYLQQHSPLAAICVCEIFTPQEDPFTRHLSLSQGCVMLLGKNTSDACKGGAALSWALLCFALLKSKGLM